MARALIVGCGCHGRELAGDLLAAGWAVRGTTRRARGLAAIEGAGIEAVVADPDRVWTVLDQLEGVTTVFWLLASATGDPALLEAIHGPRLERMLEEIVDTPVRGFVYEAGGSVDARLLDRGSDLVAAAAERWHIPCEVVVPEAADPTSWRAAMLAAILRLIS